MSNEDPLDYSTTDSRIERPLAIKIICIVGLIISLLELAGNLFAMQLANGEGNKWTYFLLIIPIVNIFCWVGFWTMRKATLILYCLNYVFTLWVDYNIGVPIIQLYSILYFIFAIVMVGQLHKMDKFI